MLGPLAAEVGDASADLGGPRQRAVLALLLTARGETLSADRMIEDLWGNAAPPRALASLQAYVSNLRRALEPGRSPRTPARLLVSAPPGYALRLAEDAVDAWRFEASVRRADARLAADPAAARTGLDEALAWWRGEAYAEFADASWAATETTRLAELRLTARELQASATLRLGHAAEASLAAETLTRDQPLREEGWRLLALSLWAADRRAEALAALRRAAEVLADELGLDPGPGLRELESAILQGRDEVLG
ncbi:hypothetical protein G5C51_22330, partial [Streptomyces sp. A7024]|nr:hypothetical protein [Streptomyces coryli]